MVIFPKDPGFFWLKDGVRNQDLGARHAHSWGLQLLPGPSRGQSLGTYVCTLAHVQGHLFNWFWLLFSICIYLKLKKDFRPMSLL